MANKNDFTPEEWTKVLESIIAAGIAVSAVAPSGWWGTFKEAVAGSRRSLQPSAIPTLTNSSRQRLLILKDPGTETFLQCANALPTPSPRNVYSAH